MPREVAMTKPQVYDLLSINIAKVIEVSKKEMAPFNEFVQKVVTWYEKAKIAAQNNDINGLKFENASEFLPLKEITNFIEETPSSERPRRNASKKATKNIAQQINLNQKLRRPTNAKIKKEKLSICLEEENIIEESLSLIAEIKKEITDMPAPTRPAPKTKNNKSLKIKKEQIEKEETKRITRSKKLSDAIIKEIKNEVIAISDSDIDVPDLGIENEQTSKKKRNRSLNEDEILSDADNRKKRSRSGSGAEDEPNPIHTEFKDCTDSLVPDDKTVNATFIATNSVADSAINSTVILQKPTFVQQMPDHLMTDDESQNETMKSSLKLATKPAKQSPVKKKVDESENLHEEATATRTTRTKTRAQSKQEQQEDDASSKSSPTQKPTNTVKEKSKLCTPISKVLPIATSTQIKANRVINNSNFDSTKLTNSALKASQSEFKERERRQKEKEEEATKKRNALLQAQMENKKRQREERQLKAQKQRELLEQEKQKQYEAQRLKEERTNKLLAEQEARKQKIREENEKKRLLSAKKKEEEKQLEELKQQEEKKNQAQKAQELKQPSMVKQKPIYLRTKAPLLPTDDCYDSDDENYTNSSCPKWAEQAQLEHQQRLALAIGEKIKNTFFTIQAQTPDLEEIFEVIEPVKLKRSSSACWTKPPRFTMMPTLLEKHQEFSEDDSD